MLNENPSVPQISSTQGPRVFSTQKLSVQHQKNKFNWRNLGDEKEWPFCVELMCWTEGDSDKSSFPFQTLKFRVWNKIFFRKDRLEARPRRDEDRRPLNIEWRLEKGEPNEEKTNEKRNLLKWNLSFSYFLT